MTQEAKQASRQRVKDFFLYPLWENYCGFYHSKFGTIVLVALFGIGSLGGILGHFNPILQDSIWSGIWIAVCLTALCVFFIDMIVVTIAYRIWWRHYMKKTKTAGSSREEISF